MARIRLAAPIVGVMMLLLALFPSAARADHIDFTNSRDSHIKDQSITFKLHTGSLTTNQRIAITAAADGWETDIGKAEGGLDFTKTTWAGDPYNTVTGWADDPFPGSNRLVWEGAFIDSWDCIDGSIACTFIRHNKDNSDPRHIKDVDTIFNYQIYWPSDGSECSVPGDSTDVSDNPPSADQGTIATHEFGHWEHLVDVTQGGTIMNRLFGQGCVTAPLNNDEHAVDYLYGIWSGHAHNAQP